MVFPQRYDGVDLPDDSCRILVIDDMPLGESILDRYDARLIGYVGGARSKLVYRIEQGMGRAVRSHADYAVIILAGPALGHFIAKHDVLSVMNPETQAQLRLAVDLAQLSMKEENNSPEDAIADLIVKCLRRDDGWKQFYNQTIRNAVGPSQATTTVEKLQMAWAERSAFDAALRKDPHKASRILRDAITKYVQDDAGSKGWYLQRAANYLYDADPGEALEVQRAAHESDRCMICPPGVVPRAKSADRSVVQSRVVAWFKGFANPNGAIAMLQDLRARLAYERSAETIEQALLDLAPLLGAEGSRPEKEYGQGPDDLWIWPDVSLVIEAKNQIKDSLHKADAGQMLLSLQWFAKNYPARKDPAAIVFSDAMILDRDADFPPSMRVVTSEGVQSLLHALEQFFARFADEPLIYSNPKSIEQFQRELRLLPEQFVGAYASKPRRMSR